MDAMFVTLPFTMPLVGVLFFFLAIRRPIGLKRYALGALQLLSIFLSFWKPSVLLSTLLPMLVPFSIGLFIHATAIAFRRPDVVLSKKNLSDQIKEAICLLTDIRGVGQRSKARNPEATDAGRPSRIHFAIRNCIHAITLWSLNWFMVHHLPTILLPHGMQIDDLSPEKQTLIPEASWHDLAVRTLMTINWIWATYHGLNLPHKILSIIFVSILGMDQPEDWPPLFGSILEATSVHRFWAVFWQKLHVRPFEAFMPSWAFQRKSKLMRAFLMFLMSAIAHALVDFAAYGEDMSAAHFWFFMRNFAVCTAEVMVLKAAKGTGVLEHRISWPAMLLFRLLGYAWVFTFFICVTPRWQFPLVWNAIMRSLGM